MKSCPTCKRTFDNSLVFCLDDGSLLSAPSGPDTSTGVTTDTEQPTLVRVPIIEPESEQQTVARVATASLPETQQPTVVLLAPTTIPTQAEPQSTNPRSNKLVYVLGALLAAVLLLMIVRETGLVGRITGSGGQPTPTAAANAFSAACRSHDIAAFKSLLSKQSLGGLTETARKENKSIDEFLGMYPDLGCDLGEVRNEVINGDLATVEGKSGSDWTPYRFIKEDGGWKIAF